MPPIEFQHGDPKDVSPAGFDQMQSEAVEFLRKTRVFFLVGAEFKGKPEDMDANFQVFTAAHVPGTITEIVAFNDAFSAWLLTHAINFASGTEALADELLEEGEDEDA